MRSLSRAKDFFNRRVLGYRHFYTLSGRSLRNERNVLQKAILNYPLQRGSEKDRPMYCAPLCGSTSGGTWTVKGNAGYPNYYPYPVWILMTIFGRQIASLCEIQERGTSESLATSHAATSNNVCALDKSSWRSKICLQVPHNPCPTPAAPKIQIITLIFVPEHLHIATREPQN